MTRLRHADAVPVLRATGARHNLLRLHFEDGVAPSLETSYVCRRQVETWLSSATEKTFQRAAQRVVASAGSPAAESGEAPSDGSDGARSPVLLVTEHELAFLKAAKVRLGPWARWRSPVVG